MAPSIDSTPPRPLIHQREIFRNPLAIIAGLIAIVELALAYPVTQLAGRNQDLFVDFMVGFPCLLLVGFFLILWFRPSHFYAPRDFQDDRTFLEALGKAQPARPSLAAEPGSKSPIPRRSRDKRPRKDVAQTLAPYTDSVQKALPRDTEYDRKE